MTEAEKTGVDNPYRYSTKEWDEKSGLYYLGARYYSPEIGRWTQRDLIATAGQVCFEQAGLAQPQRAVAWLPQFKAGETADERGERNKPPRARRLWLEGRTPR
jgi:RHS repeat-associated protein